MLSLPRRPRIAVFRALYLGDLLCAVPALRALKKKFPDSEVTYIGLPWTAELIERFSHLIDDFTVFPGFPGLPEQVVDPKRVVDFLSSMQDRNFDLVIQMHGRGDHVNELCSLMAPQALAGFYERGRWCPNAERFVVYPQDMLELRRLLLLMRTLGVEPDGEHLELPVLSQDFAFLRRHPFVFNPFVCVHPGGKSAMRWRPEKFAAVIRGLRRLGYNVILTGTKDEAELNEEVNRISGGGAVDLCGKTSIGELAALISRCDLLISNDTGVSHVAAALSVPSVIVFPGDQRKAWPPLNTVIHRFVRGDVSPAVVMSEAEELLGAAVEARVDSLRAAAHG